MEAAIEMAESGHLVIGTLHTKSCAETIDRMINFYEVRDQASIKYLLSSLLKLVVAQRLLKGKDGKTNTNPRSNGSRQYSIRNNKKRQNKRIRNRERNTK